MRYYLRNAYVDRVALAVVLDLLVLAIAAAATWAYLQPAYDPAAYALTVAGGAGLMFVALYYTEAYGLTVLGSGRRTLNAVFSTMGIVAALAGLVYFFAPVPPASFPTAAHLAALYFSLLLVGRLGYRVFFSLPGVAERVLIVGTSDLGRMIARALHERRNLGTEVVGFLSDVLDDQGAWIEGRPVCGRVNELEKVLLSTRIHRIVVASKEREEHFPAEVLLSAKLRGVRVESGVSFYERITGRIYLRELRPSYLIFSAGFASGPVYRAVKRGMDLAAAGAGVALFGPLLPLCAAAIRLDSRGPIFYSQERVGLGGRTFRVRKLRTMYTDAEKDGPVWTAAHDDRVTRVGGLLRKARVDELPQLWNVLMGQMSLVGPRPERPEFAEGLCARYPYFRYRAAVKPGITGWAQIRYGYVNDADQCEEKLALDLYYLKHQSLTMDLMILWKTIKTVVLLRGL